MSPEAVLGALRRRPGREMAGIALALSALLLSICAVAGMAIWEMRRSAGERAEDALANLTLSLERGLTYDLLSYDFLLQSIARGFGSAMRPEELEQQIQLWRSSRPNMTGSVIVTDAQGKIVRTDADQVVGADALMSERVEAHRADPLLGLHAGELGKGRLSNGPQLVVSRRWTDAGGQFAGVVEGSLRLDYFLQAFANFRLGMGGSVTLLTLDGRLVASSAMRAGGEGLDLGRSAVMQRLRAHGPGVFAAPSIVDGKERLYYAVRLDGLPFYLVVGRLTSDIYADSNRRMLAIVSLILVMSVVLGGLTFALHSELGRRVLAERQARRSAADAREIAADLETVTDNADDLILKVDWNGTRRFVSPASERLLGYRPEELLGRDSMEFTHPDDRTELRRLLLHLRESGDKTAQVTYRVIHRDGEQRNVEARCRSLPDGSGAIIAVRDVTERVALEARLRQAQKMEAVGQLTAGVARDFNNMLQAQIAGLELLEARVKGHPEAERLAAQAITTAMKGARLTHSLLAFSRQQILRPAPVDVEAMLGELRVLLSRTLGPKVRLEVEVEAGLARPMVDRAQLESAVLNLCLNGRDAMKPQGGRLRVEARAVAGMDGAPVVSIAVTDEGCGMAPEVLSRVCEPFFTTKNPGEGSGLGLSMVHGFAAQSNGVLRLQSRLGEGARAEILLPVAELREAGAEPNTAGEAAREAKAGPRGCVLLVDDDDDVRVNVREVLAQAGYDVVQARSGGEAAAILRSSVAVDLLVTDHGMPGMTGVALVRLAHALRPRLPAMLITGYMHGELLGNVPECIEVLHKPFRHQELLARLDELREVAPLLA